VARPRRSVKHAPGVFIHEGRTHFMTADLPLADELAAVYARMAGLLLSEETVATAVRLVTSLATETVPGTAGAGITLLDAEGRPTSRGSSNDVVEQADRLQYELGEGPCLTAWRHRSVIRVDDVAEDTRFPRWSAAVRPLGLGSSLSTPLVAGDVSLGALKVYSGKPHNFGPQAEHLLTLFAAQAAILLANVQSYEQARQLSDQLREALRSRDVIGQAKGILMEREGVDDQRAFARLVAISRNSNRKLRDVAREVVRSVAERRR
jgi:GAF domain-containing protein